MATCIGLSPSYRIHPRAKSTGLSPRIFRNLSYIAGVGFPDISIPIWVTSSAAGFAAAEYWYFDLPPVKLGFVVLSGFVLYYGINIGLMFSGVSLNMAAAVDVVNVFVIWCISYFVPVYAVFVLDVVPEKYTC